MPIHTLKQLWDMNKENLSTVAGTSYWIFPEYVKISMATKHDTNPKWKLCHLQPIFFRWRWSGGFVFLALCIIVYTPINANQTNGSFVPNKQSIPLLIWPVLNFWHHIKRPLRYVGINVTYHTCHCANKQNFYTVKLKIIHPVVYYTCFAISPASCRLVLLACRTS